MATKVELKQKALALGMDVNARMSKAELASMIDRAQEGVAPVEAAQRTRVKNVSTQRWMAFDKALDPGEIYQPTKQDLSNARALAKIKRAVELGKLEWC